MKSNLIQARKKSKLTISIILIFVITILASCNKHNQEEIIESKYSNLALLVKDGLENIGQNLREQQSTFNDQELVKLSVEEYYSDEPEIYHVFFTEYEKSISKSHLKNTANNEVINAVVDDIEIGLVNSSDAGEFTDFLQAKFDEVFRSEMQLKNKDLLLQYIVTYKTSIEFIRNNQDIIPHQNDHFKKGGWWKSWGKCVAGIVGGAGLGGLAGGAAASVIPGLGTVAGIIVGGVSGGLSGAAASC